ncbi:MAG: hypothetical protein IPH04_05795 [Saprospirales bacterium]|nr:hypothetical protein [Saprospirales bacterium]
MDQHSEGSDGATLRLYTYRDHCALVGRFQNIHAELDLEACVKNGIDFGRRLTGGGAIIMGSEQLGICLAAHSKSFEWGTVRELCGLMARPIIQALEKLGIEATFRAKNDLEVNGKKIAGLGVYVNPQGAFHFHASLLADLDIGKMLSVLQIPVQKFEDKQKIQRVEQRITTVSREAGRKVNIAEIRTLVKNSFEEHFGISFEEQPVSAEEKRHIEHLENERYRNEEWLYQHSPQPDMTGMSLKKTAAGLLRTYIGLKGETIKSVLITGDFLEDAGLLSQIEAQLKWSPLEKERIAQAVDRIFSSNNTGLNISPHEVTDAIWMAGQRALAANRYTYEGSCYYPEEVEKLKS